MKKFLLLIFTFAFTGCYQDFIDVMTEETVYSYKPRTRLVKRILYYNNAEEIIQQFGGDFSNLTYLGKIITALPSDYYILTGCIKNDTTKTVYIKYEDSIIYIDGANSGIEDKYLFVYYSDYFKHYLILRKKSKPELDWIYWEIDKYEN